jgi:hypothetical protein
MIREALADQQVIKRATKDALDAWLRQSERLDIARKVHNLRGPRFVDFARRIGITDHIGIPTGEAAPVPRKDSQKVRQRISGRS